MGRYLQVVPGYVLDEVDRQIEELRADRSQLLRGYT